MTDLPPFNTPPPRPGVPPPGPAAPEPSVSEARPPEPPRRGQPLRTVSLWGLRWALLGVGIGGAWLLGVLVAQFFPATNPEPPLQEIVSRKTSRFWQKLVRLPEWWAGDAPLPVTGPSPAVDPPPATTSSPPPIALTEAQREQVDVELEAIAADLQGLRDRASAVERQLGLPNIDRPLADRVDDARDRLSPPTATALPAPDPTPSALQPATGEVRDPLFQVSTDRVTLPSDILFAPAGSALQPDAQPLLESLLPELSRYPNATIVVGSYTDIATEQTTPTELSYQQAIAVQQYLSQRLGEDSVHWVTVGYGNSNIGSTGGVQLSRRVTITIAP
ncbi:MAG: OmpA family protein [Leptolyngbyaceae cyanobacterium]